MLCVTVPVIHSILVVRFDAFPGCSDDLILVSTFVIFFALFCCCYCHNNNPLLLIIYCKSWNTCLSACPCWVCLHRSKICGLLPAWTNYNCKSYLVFLLLLLLYNKLWLFTYHHLTTFHNCQLPDF